MKSIGRKRTIIGILISAVLLLLAAKSVDFKTAVSYINEFDKGLMLLGLVIWLIGYGVRAVRWQIFLNNISVVSWRDSFRVLMIGFATNNLLPLRAGEFIRAYLLHRVAPKVSTSSAFATVAGERLFDGIAVVMITIFGATSLDLPAWAVSAICISIAIFVTAFVSFLALVSKPGVIEWVVRMIPERFRGQVAGLFYKFVEGLGVIKSMRAIGILVMISLVVWLMEAGFYYLSAISFGIELSFINACFLMGILNLAVMIPAAPGGLGAFEFVTVQSLSLLGVSESLAFSYAVVSHIIQNGSVIIIGLYYLSRMGLTHKARSDMLGKVQ